MCVATWKQSLAKSKTENSSSREQFIGSKNQNSREQVILSNGIASELF